MPTCWNKVLCVFLWIFTILFKSCIFLFFFFSLNYENYMSWKSSLGICGMNFQTIVRKLDKVILQCSKRNNLMCKKLSHSKVNNKVVPSPIPCPSFIHYFLLFVKPSNHGMKSWNWGPMMKITRWRKFKIFFDIFSLRFTLKGLLKVYIFGHFFLDFITKIF
jgi:hypothetical protein